MNGEMKRIFRGLVLITVCVLLVISLTGCRQLDEKRENTAYWADDEHTAILYRGKTYESVDTPGTFGETIAPRTVVVAEKDIPLLLTGNYGTYARLSMNEKVFILEWYEQGVFRTAAFVLPEYKEYFKQTQTDPKMEYFTEDMTEFTPTFDEAAVDAIKATLENEVRSDEDDGAKEIMRYIQNDSFWIPDSTMEFVGCDRDLLVNHYMYLYKTDGYYICDADKTVLYKASPEYSPVFDKLFNEIYGR